MWKSTSQKITHVWLTTTDAQTLKAEVLKGMWPMWQTKPELQVCHLMVAENIVKTGGERRKKTFKKVNFGFESATKIKKKQVV